jgi:peroxiredoxin
MGGATRGTAQTVDDGAYAHLSKGAIVPEIALPATTGESLGVVAATPFTVLFLYPMTGVPGQPLPDGWLELPGAFGCTAESCGYRDLAEELTSAGATIHGVSTQSPAEQREFAERERIGYPLLSDERRRLVDGLRLPLLHVPGHPPRIKRATLIVDRERRLLEIMYPVPDPSANAAEALASIQQLASGRQEL